MTRARSRTGPFSFVRPGQRGYNAAVHFTRVVPPLAAAAAAWLAAGWGWFVPLLWLALLLTCLALPPAQRRLLDGRWVVLVAALGALSLLSALDRDAAVAHTLTFAAAALLFALARLAAPSGRTLELLAAAVALAAVPALAQGAGALGELVAAVDALPPAMRAAAAARLTSGRAFGTAALPGHFAALQLMTVPLLAAAAARQRGVRRAAFALLALLSCAGIAATRSLAALGVAALLLGALAARRRSVPGVALGVAALAAVAVATLLWRGDLATLEPVRLRLVNWRVAWAAWIEHPWLGVGFGGVGQAGLAGPLGAENITPYAHNSYLQLLAELGVAGAGVLAAALVALARLLWRAVREQLPLALSVLVLPLHNLVDFSLYAPEVVLPWAVLLGALAVRCAAPPPSVTPSPMLVALLGLGVVLASFAWITEEGVRQAWAAHDPRPAVAAARWSPWALTPVLAAAELALQAPPELATLREVLALIERRAHGRPASAATAEVRARLLVRLGRAGEGCAWAATARGRAPWRGELAELEEACCGDGGLP